MLLWALGWIYLFKLVCLFSSDISPVVEFLSHMVILFLAFLSKVHTVFHIGCINLQSHKHSVCVCARTCTLLLSHVWLFVTLRTIASQAPLSMGFSRQEYWSGLLFPPPGDLPWPSSQTHVSWVFCIGRWVFFLTTEPPRKPNKIVLGF